MTCFSFLCSSFGANDPLRTLDATKPLTQAAPVKQHAATLQSAPTKDPLSSSQSPSLSPSLSASLSSMGLGQSPPPLPSRTVQTQSSGGGYDDSRRGSLDTTQLNPIDESLAKSFSVPMPARTLFQSLPTNTAIDNNNGKRSSISASSVSTASTGEDSGRSYLSASPPNRVSPSLPPTHPNTRRLRDVHRELAAVVEQRPVRVTPRAPPPSPVAPLPPQGRRASQPHAHSHATPLRARRLQRHRALSSPGSPASMYIRTTHIDSTPALQSYFTSQSARTLMSERLQKGLIAVHHDAMSHTLVYRHFSCDNTLAILSCTDIGASQPACQLMCPAITKVVRGISTRQLIEKVVDGGETLKDETLLSICTHEGSIDIECVSQVERDEWFLAFDFLVYYWNEQRRVANGSPSPMVPGRYRRSIVTHDSKGDSGLINQLADLHDRCQWTGAATHSPTSCLATMQPAAYHSHPGGVMIGSREMYEVISMYARDVELVRELNRASLIGGCSALAQMQSQIDALRESNAQIIEHLREQ